MRRFWILMLVLMLAAAPVFADDPPPAPTGLQTEIFPDHPEIPIYLWNDVDGADGYVVDVYDASGTNVYEASLSESGHCVPTQQCAHQQPTALAAGQYSWKVEAHNDAGYSAESVTVIFVVSAYSVPGFDPVASPTPLPSNTPSDAPTPELPTNNLINTLATAEGALASAPSVSSVDSSDASLNQNSTTIFGYIKWVLSTRSAEEIFGPFSPFVLTAATVLTILLVIATAFFLFFLAVRLIRLVVWVVMTVRRLLPF